MRCWQMQHLWYNAALLDLCMSKQGADAARQKGETLKVDEQMMLDALVSSARNYIQVGTV